MAEESGAGDDRQVSCRFVTKLPGAYRVPPDAITVPASVTRLGLSRIVNHLLALDRPLPLDFLIHGELLRDSLGALLSERDITAEATLDIEYTPLLGPPDVEDGPPHDDWVSCVAALRGGSSASPALVSGSYDGQLRVHAAQGKSLACVAEAEAHGGPVTCCAAEGGMVYSGGKDGWVRAWRVGKGGALDGLARMGGRDGAPAVAAVAVAPGGAFVASGGWDSAVRLWRAGAALEDAAAEAAGGDEKGRKRRGGSTRPVATVSECEATLDKHTQCVSGLSWPVADTLVSCGWDHAVRVWDAETRACRDTLAAPRAAFCVAVREGDARCIAAIGGADKAWRLWDPRGRSADGAVVLRAFHSHRGWVSGVAWSPASEHLLLTTSFDGAAKLWDIRASVPLHSVDAHTDKVLCAAWMDTGAAATGGADGRLVVLRVPPLLAQ